jgi:hypothetical protein
MRPGRLRSALVLFVLLVGACASSDSKAQPPAETKPTVSTPPTVASFAEVKAADGKVVRVTGKLQHEKLGDVIILADGLDLLCPDFRVRDEGAAEATLEGRLELWEPPVAGVDEEGQVMQGVAEGTPARWVLRGCKQL